MMTGKALWQLDEAVKMADWAFVYARNGRTAQALDAIEDAMVALTVDLVMSLSSSTTVPLTLLKAPRTVEMAIWRTENCADECCGSIFHSDVAAPAGSDRTAASAAFTAIRDRWWPMIFSSWYLIG